MLTNTSELLREFYGIRIMGSSSCSILGQTSDLVTYLVT